MKKPFVLISAAATLILLIGVYTGYRLTELKRFRPLVLPCSEKF